jgi:SAM-dependent methyltransferase
MVHYDLIGTHRWMLRDSARTEAFRRALMKTVPQGGAVLDVGAGTGILSLFAAQAGARSVYAIERTPIATLAAELVHRNGFSHIVQVVRADMERAVIPERVDVIVSEWLGSIGINENLLLPVLLARDRWLKPGGAMIPAVVTAWAAPAGLSLLPDATWFKERPYGLDLSLLSEPSIHDQLSGVRRVVPEELAATPLPLWRGNVQTMRVEQARLPARADLTFEFTGTRRVNAVVAWFEARLAQDCVLSNSPSSPETHWGQLMLPLNRSIECNLGDRLSLRVLCIPSGSGQSQMAWSARWNEGPWEHHDTRVYPAVVRTPMRRIPSQPAVAPRSAPRSVEPDAQQTSSVSSAAGAGRPDARPITRFLARLAVDPDLLRQFLHRPLQVLNACNVPADDQKALLSRNARAIEAAMLKT